MFNRISTTFLVSIGGSIVVAAALVAAGSTSAQTRGGDKSSTTSGVKGTFASSSEKPSGTSLPAAKDSRSGGSPTGSLSASSTTRIIKIEHGLVSSLDPIKLPAREPGSITAIMVKKGQEVQAGDMVCQIDETDAKTKKVIAERERDAAQEKAESIHEVKAAKDGAKVAEENYKSMEALRAKNLDTVSEFEFRRSRFEWQRSIAQIGVAETEQSVARLTQLAKEAQIQAADNELVRRKLTSPIDGVVVQLYKHVGEWAQPGEAVLEIVRMNRVEIEGYVLAKDASASELMGKPVKVRVQLAGPENIDKPHEFMGVITFASPVLQGTGSNRQFRVATEVDNTKVGGYWVIQPGTEATMEIDLSPPAPPKPAGSNPAKKPAFSGMPKSVNTLKPVTDRPTTLPSDTKKAETKSSAPPADEKSPKTTNPKVDSPKPGSLKPSLPGAKS